MVGPSSLRILVTRLFALVWITGCATTGDNKVQPDWQEIYAAQDRAAPTPTAIEFDVAAVPLEALLQHAERNNPGLRAVFDRWTAALEQVPQAKSLPDPRVSYAYFIESVETRVGPQRQKFGVAQTIPLFGKLGLKGDMALSAANAAGAHFEQSRLQLRFEVSRLWNDYFFLHRAIAVTEESFRLMSYLEDVALARYTVGKAPHASVIRAQVELGKLEDRLRSLRDQRRPLLASLNAELNRPPQTPIAWPESLSYQHIPQTTDELTESLRTTNPRLAAQRFRIDREVAAEKLAGRSPIPDLTIGFEYINNDESGSPNVLDSGKDAAIAKATLSIPLWFTKYKAEKAEANALRSASEREFSHLQNRLLAEFERVHFELRNAERRVELYAHSLLPKAQQSLEVTEEAFTTGSLTFLDLVDAQRTLLEFELAHARALADRATHYAHLMTTIGHGTGRDIAPKSRTRSNK